MLRGPASAIYGSNAGGVIQMFSRDGAGAPKVGVDTTFGSDGFNKNHVYGEGGNDYAGFVLDASGWTPTATATTVRRGATRPLPRCMYALMKTAAWH